MILLEPANKIIHLNVGIKRRTISLTGLWETSTLAGPVVSEKWDEQVFGSERLFPMKKPMRHLIAEVLLRSSKVGMTIGIDLGDVWSHYCTLNEDGEVVGRGRFRTSPSGVEKWFTDLPPVRIAMEAGTHSIWISEQLQELGHEVIVATYVLLSHITSNCSVAAFSVRLGSQGPHAPRILGPWFIGFH